jgi:ribosomal protein L35
LTGKTTKLKRKMRKLREVADQDAPKLQRMLPYK